MLMPKPNSLFKGIFVLLLCCSTVAAFGQSADNIIITKDYQGTSLLNVIKDIEQSEEVHFIFKESWLESLYVNESTLDMPLSKLLSLVIGSKGLTVTFRGKNIILYQQDNVPFSVFAAYAEARYGVSFTYREDWIKNFQISKSFIGKEYKGALEQMLQGSLLQVTFREQNIIIYRKSNIDTSLDSNEIDKDIIVVGNGEIATSADETVSISGQIKDSKTGDDLLGARVYVEETRKAVVANYYGFYSIDLTPGYYTLVFDYVGFERSVVKILLQSGGPLDIEMYENSILLNEVTVEELAASENVTAMDMGRNTMSIREISRIPAFMGEADAVKSFLTLPGVNTVGEGSSGFNVRGGATDQNLFLFDGVPVFNPSHLFGFFSGFNTDLVKNATLYKGSIPAQFGDRASSVFDVHTSDEVAKLTSLKGGLGLVYSRLTLELPVVKDKSSITIGARRSYADWMLKGAQNLEVKQSAASFDDFNIKWNTALGKKDKLSFSLYNSNDSFKFAEDTVYNWSTNNYALKWRHLFGKRWFGILQAYEAGYSYDLEGQQVAFEFNLKSKLLLRGLKAHMTFVPKSGHTINFGAEVKRYFFSPGVLSADEASQAVPKTLQTESSREEVLFVQNEMQLGSRLSTSIGLRAARFSALGSGDTFQYENGQPRNTGTITDTVNYENGSVVKHYYGLEPRLSLKYTLNNSSSLKLSFNRMQQYIHTISNTVAVSPIDTWKPSDLYIKPQTTDQISLGYFRNFKDDKIETSVEVYYKRLDNILEYKNGATVLLNENIEQVLLNGKGRAYGIEAYVKKSYGKLTGWMSYTYSRSERRFQSMFTEETINNGNYFPADYDRPHTFSLVANHQLTKRWSFGFNFSYSTGRPTTLPQAKYSVRGITFASFSNRNQRRIPAYHRLDFSVTLDTGHKKNKLWSGSWTLALYNVYMRENAYSVFFRNERGSPPSAYQLSVLGTIFPSLTYNFKFVGKKSKKAIKI